MNMRKNPVLLIFGYPLTFDHFGGLVCIKRVTDYIEKNNLLSVKKVNSYFDQKKQLFQHIVHLRAVLEGCHTSPNIAILDTYGEATLLMWILLRLFKPSAKIVTVFHHYAPQSVKHKKARVSTKIYSKMVDYLTKIMLNNNDNILTVSLASSNQLDQLLTTSNLSNSSQSDSTDVAVTAGGDRVTVTWWETNETSAEPLARTSSDSGKTFGPAMNLAYNGTIGTK